MGLRPNWYQIRNKTCYIQKVNNFCLEKRYLMLTGLNASSSTCKCVFYRPEHNAKTPWS